MAQTLFDVGAPVPKGPGAGAPLAIRLRPRHLDEVVGQQHLLRAGAPLSRLAAGRPAPSLVLWGPPGSGKTTLAHLIGRATGAAFIELSAVSAGVREVREAVAAARSRRAAGAGPTVLFIDEVHRFSRTQQDALLPSVENADVTLVAATTENPSFSVVTPLLSRCLLLTLQPLTAADLTVLLDRALTDPRGFGGRLRLGDGAAEHLLRLADGDARRLLTVLEAAAQAVGEAGTLDLSAVEQAADRAATRYDATGDQHYDIVSAFIKSVRGSDPDAALHYLARMIEGGEDPRFVARRLVVAASEDIGLADPAALGVAVAAAQTVALVGLPECRLALAQVTLHLALAPKSNAVITAVDAALADVRAGAGGPVPVHLRDAHYAGAARLGHGSGYRYPHDEPGGVAVAVYAPEGVRDRRYYQPRPRGAEVVLAERLAELAAARGREPNPVPDPIAAATSMRQEEET